MLASDGVDEWRQATSEAAESLGVMVAVQPVDATAIPAPAEQGPGWTGAALLRPDGVVAWKPDAPAADGAEALGAVMARVLSR